MWTPSLRAVPVLLALAGSLSAQTPSLPPDFELVEVALGTYASPVTFTFAPDGTIFLLLKDGKVILTEDGIDQSTPFIDISAEVNNWGDRGSLGIALHPGFVPDGGPTSWVYLLYTVSPVPGANVPYDGGDGSFAGQFSFSRLTRYQAVTVAGEIVADLASRQILLGNQLPDGAVPDCIASIHESHSNGALAFADDGSLIVGIGDGAHWDIADTGGNDPGGFDDFTHPTTLLKGPTPKEQDSGSFRAQDLRSLAGKLLRLNPTNGNGLASNPFFDGDLTSNASRVWSMGLRYPFRFALKPGTGSTNFAEGNPNTILIGDIGWFTWEEFNISEDGGENFGWPCIEGTGPQSFFDTHDHGANPYGFPDCLSALPGTVTAPRMAYHHIDATLVDPPGVYMGNTGTPDPAGFKGFCIVGGQYYQPGEYPSEYDGRYFFADYASDWVKTIEFGPSDTVVGVHDFASAFTSIIDIQRHPISGDLYFLTIANPPDGQLFHLRYGPNSSPIAIATSDVTTGPAALEVNFDGTTSSDPDNDPLIFEWNFGDGSPVSNLLAPQHTYTADGIYEASLKVTDPEGLFSIDTVQIIVGNTPPTVAITSPAPGITFVNPATINLTATASDLQDVNLTWDWRVDLYHNTHQHPDTASGSNPNTFAYTIGTHGNQLDLVYYSFEVTVTDSGGASASDRIYVYPEDRYRDVAGTSTHIATLNTLSPPFPTGTGNIDFEVIRDGVLPPVTETDTQQQFDTTHGGDQGTDEWIGWELTFVPDSEFRFVALTFQEGLHYPDGGWWETLDVEVRNGGVWSPVQNLRISPDYPFENAAVPLFDGQSFDVYELTFDPAFGDAIRLRGDPGGTTGFISVAELRAHIIAKDDGSTPGYEDVTDEGAVIGKIFELSPPTPQGAGSPDPNTIKNGTMPAFGSTSDWAQFDTTHGGDQGTEDWIGYVFPTTKSFGRVVFQEGKNSVLGGWLDTLDVEVRAKGDTVWTPVSNLTVMPGFPGSNVPPDHYEIFTLEFDPILGREIRIVGDPGGILQYMSVGELRVFETVATGPCGWTEWGPGVLASDVLTLDSYSDPILGNTLDFEIVGSTAPGPTGGWLVLSAKEGYYKYGTGTILIDPITAFIMVPAFAVDTDGEGFKSILLPLDPTLAGGRLVWQSVVLETLNPLSLLYSNALVMTICP